MVSKMDLSVVNKPSNNDSTVDAVLHNFAADRDCENRTLKSNDKFFQLY